MEHYTTRDRQSTVSGTVSSLTVNDKKLKDPTEVANGFSNFFITVMAYYKRGCSNNGMTGIDRWNLLYYCIVEESVLGAKLCLPASCRLYREKRGSAFPPCCMRI
jgi:hypothetical protein